MPYKKTTIALVDDMDLDQALLTYHIKKNKNYEIVLYATNGFDLLEKLKNQQPEIIVIDIYMPLMDGLSTIEHLYKQNYSGNILCVTNGFEYNLISFLKEKGAKGFSRKDGNYVLKALDMISNGKEFWDNEYLQSYSKYDIKPSMTNFQLLTEEINGKEIEIINLLANGLSSEEICKHLGYSYFTIEAQIQNIVRRLSLKNRSHLVAYAFVYGLINNFESFKHFKKPKTQNPKPKTQNPIQYSIN